MTWREWREVGGDGGESGREWMEKGAEGEEEADGMGEGGRVWEGLNCQRGTAQGLATTEPKGCGRGKAQH